MILQKIITLEAAMDETVKKTTSSNQSSEKLLDLMEFLSQEESPIRLSELAARLNMNISTVSRFLTTLQNRGYVSQSEERGTYVLTYKICQLANNVTSRIDFRSICLPHLRRVARIFGCTTNLMARYEYSVIYLDVLPGPEQLVVPLQRIGKVAPLYCTGGGKLFLSHFSSSELRSYAGMSPFHPYTEYTICSLGQLQEELERIRRDGYAIDNQECELGTRCLAAPIYNYTGGIQAAISINAPISKLTDQYIQKNAPILKEIAMEISHQLGYVESAAH